jgi:hypothetical protein
LKPDVLKPDVLKPDVLKPDVLWVYRSIQLHGKNLRKSTYRQKLNPTPLQRKQIS